MSVAKERTNALRPCAIGLIFSLLLPILLLSPALAQAPIVSAIKIEGNQRVEQDAIRINISQHVGEPLNPVAINNDVKAIYGMGFFEDVDVRKDVQPGGKVVVTYIVKERPQITDVKFVGMKEFKPTDDKVLAATKIHPGSILNPVLVSDTAHAVADLYHTKGYLDVVVTPKTVEASGNTAVEEFDISEGAQVRITKIEFTGNHAFSSRELKAQMDTSTHNFLSWITGAGVLDRKKLDQDVDRLGAFYYDNGYLNVHVSPPDIIRHGNDLTIKMTIDEGPVYGVGTVDLAGNLIYPKAELDKLLTIHPGDQFRGSTMQHNVLTLSDFYSNRGYAYVNVDPQTQLDPTARKVNIKFVINPGHEVLVNRIRISGNTKTSDKVIRREMQLQEQEPYSAEAIRDSKARLDRLGFFSDTRITTEPSNQPDKIDLNVNVSEGNTASLSVAGGFDSYQSLFGNFVLGNTNLFGGGESAMLSAEVGFLFKSYTASYTEPWFLDIPLSVTMQLFDSETDLFTFTQSAIGGGINTYYPLTELGFKRLGPFSLKDVSAGLGYQFQVVGITGLSPFTTFDIARYHGYTKISEVMPSIRRFTVDNPIDPRSGSVQSLNLEMAGAGPGTAFVKGVAHARFFYTFLKSHTFGSWVFSPGVTYGIGTRLSQGFGGDLPLYERFFPGGVGGQGDVRGYQLYSLGPLVTFYNQAGQPISIQDVGGSKELLVDSEITFPILSGLGIRGVVFADAGQAWRLRESMDPTTMQAAYGVGIRWRSPFGPLAVDIARPINPRPQDLSTVFEIGGGSPL